MRFIKYIWKNTNIRRKMAECLKIIAMLIVVVIAYCFVGYIEKGI
jgi:hypothetical protein